MLTLILPHKVISCRLVAKKMECDFFIYSKMWKIFLVTSHENIELKKIVSI